MAAWQIFHSFRRGQLSNGTVAPGFPIDFEATAALPIKMALINNNAPVLATNEYWSEISGNEVSAAGPGYAAGGETLTMLLGPKGAIVNVDSNSPTWAQDLTTGFTDAYFAILYMDSSTATTSPLIAFNDITGPKGNVSGPLTLTTTTGLFDQTQT